ncbi:Endoglucanase 6 [Acorus calamus]|uniref:Endoglucanase 6 n=1 Tax=Acorus calamus TaxID=4465 RepID=A0AAV9CKG4_ACOCL|nr:Endoglucanase 6 [Acorus calamus]
MGVVICKKCRGRISEASSNVGWFEFAFLKKRGGRVCYTETRYNACISLHLIKKIVMGGGAMILMGMMLMMPLLVSGGGHDYGKALSKSLLFFEAQRSVWLPRNAFLKQPPTERLVKEAPSTSVVPYVEEDVVDDPSSQSKEEIEEVVKRHSPKVVDSDIEDDSVHGPFLGGPETNELLVDYRHHIAFSVWNGKLNE